MKILKQPNVCALTKNAMVFELEASNQFATPKIYPKVAITFDIRLLVGNFFEFAFLNPRTKNKEIVRFRTVNTPTIEGDITGYTTLGDLDAATTLMVSELKNLKLLSSFYDVVKIAAGSIEIVAKYPLESLIPDEIQQNFSDVPAHNFAYVVSEAFNEPIERDGYQIKALIYYNNPGNEFDAPTNFELISVQSLTVDENSKCFVDVQEILNGKIESEWDEIPLPPYTVPNDSLVYFKTPNLRQYYVVFKEFWDEEPIEFTVQSSKLFCHWGGISTDDEITKDAINHILTARKFLTWIPSGKHINKGQVDFLYFMNGATEKEWRLKVNVQFHNSVSLVSLFDINLKPFETFGFYSNIEKMIDAGLVSVPGGDEVVRYEFQIFEYDVVAAAFEAEPCEKFMYYFEDNCLKKYILYFNSFGVAETFSTHNEWEETMNVSSEIATRGLLYNSSALRSKSFLFNSVHQNSIVMQSSLIRREEARRLQSMLTSTYTFVLEEKRWIPVLIETKKAKVWNNSIFTQYLEMEMIKANSSDRASFFQILPNLLIENVDYSIYFKLNLNNFDLVGISSLLIYNSDGTLNRTIAFTTLENAFISAAAANNWHTNQLTEGVYAYKFVTTERNGTEHTISGVFEYVLQKFDYLMEGTGTPEFILASDVPTPASVYIGYNVSLSDSTISYANIKPNFDVPHPFGAATGFKRCFLLAPTFKDVKVFNSDANNFQKLDIQRLYNLSDLILSNCSIEDKLYVSKLQLIENITLFNVSISEIEIGFLPKLNTITINGADLNQDAMESLITEFWNFRKMYGHAVTINLIGMGAVNTESDALINGTGVYAGDGLLDNNFTVTLTP